MNRPETRLICFDLGGVVVRTCRSWSEGAAAAGVPYRAAIEKPEARRRFSEVVWRYETGRLTRGEYLREGAGALGGVYTEKELLRIHDAWLRGEFSGLDAIVRALNGSDGLRTGCLSNTNERHWELMSSDAGRFAAFAGLADRWSSHLLGVAKPGAAIYREFAERSGAEPGAILFFDDLEENVAAAREGGWRAEWIDREGDIAAQIHEGLARAGVRL